ncbi:hypothetical protein ACOSQ2_027228 [Xanthoceras sorbifolium]
MATTYMDFLCDSRHGTWKGSQLHGLLVGHHIHVSQPHSVNWDFNKRPNDVEKKMFKAQSVIQLTPLVFEKHKCDYKSLTPDFVCGLGLHKGLVIEDVGNNTVVGNEAVA